METNNQNVPASNPIKKHPKILLWSVIIAIVIVMNLFFNYALSLFYTEPQYETYCPMNVYNQVYDTKDQCIATGGSWNEQVVPVDTNTTTAMKTKISGYCDQTYTCNKTYQSAQKVYNRDVFIILIALGILALILGVFVKISLLSIAFSWGGVLSLLIASVRYWGSADNLIRVIILALALCALVWLAIKKFNE